MNKLKSNGMTTVSLPLPKISFSHLIFNTEIKERDNNVLTK